MEKSDIKEAAIFWLGVGLGTLLGIVGNIWVEFYIRFLKFETWPQELINIVFFMLTFILIVICFICFYVGLRLLKRIKKVVDENGES